MFSTMNYGKKPAPIQHQDNFKRTTRSKRKKEEEEEIIRKRNMPPPPPPPPVERVEADFGHTVFPNEIWDKIFFFLTRKDLHSLTYTSKSLRNLANRLLWADYSLKPIKNGMKGEDFETLLHLPIQKLRTCDLYFKRKNDAAWFAEMFKQMSHLTEVEVFKGQWATNDITIDTLQTIAPFVTKMTLDCIRPTSDCTRTELLEEIAGIDFPKLKSVKFPGIVLSGCANPMHSRCTQEECVHRHFRYTLEGLQSINHLPITELNLSCLQPRYEIDQQGWCVFDPYTPTPFPQVPLLLQMRSLTKVTVDSYQTLTDNDIAHLKELRSKNGVTLEYGRYIRESLRKVLDA